MIRPIALLVAVALLVTACGTSDPSSPSSKLVTSPPTPAGSPLVATPTAMIARPAPTASPLPSPDIAVVASPSPVAVASPPASVASPAASGAAAASPVAASPSPGGASAAAPRPPGSGPRFRLISERSEALYRAQETFANQPGPSVAVGRTNDIDGEIELEQDGILRGRVLVMRIDLRTLTSDQSRRDNYIRQNTLQADQFPYAEFRSTEAAGPATYRAGEEAAFQIPGIMTVKGRDKAVTWDARAKLDGDSIVGTATTRVRLTEFGLQPPRLAILSVEDEMTWEIEIVAERLP